MGKTARNMSELNTMLLQKISAAMQEVKSQALMDMKEQTSEFYDYASPVKYRRTHALEDSPKTSDIVVNSSFTGGDVSFDAYLDQNHRYRTGKNPTMHQVLEVAESHKMCSYYKLRAPVGHQGFWRRSQKSIASDLRRIMRKHFKARRIKR